LREQKARASEISGRSVHELEDADENIPIQAFQRAMGRLFYVLRDEKGFESKDYDQNGNNYVGWGEFCYVWKDRNITVRLSRSERIYLTFDDPQSSYAARILSVVTLSTIVMSSLGFILSTVPDLQDWPDNGEAPKPGPVFDYIENSCLVIFVLEYLVRLCTCWAIREDVFDKGALLELVTGYERIKLTSPVMRVVKFVFNMQNLIDLAAILPGVITWVLWIATGDHSHGGGGFVVLRLIRLTRIFRAFRLGKYVEPVLVITRTVKQSTKALYVLAFNLLLGVVIFGSLMYLMEQGEWDTELREYVRVESRQWNQTLNDYEDVMGVTPFESIPHAFWWALVTSTTVGYGDHYPTTSNGYIVAVVCMVWSLVILALPVGVIGGTFTQVWDQFAKNKISEAATLRREMKYVAHAYQRIEPAVVSRLLLLQVWNEDGQYESMPASPEDFMGEVKLELELPPDQIIRGKEMRLKLKQNLQIVKKEISGSIVVRYDWIPTEPGTAVDQVEETDDLPLMQKVLHGQLRLEIIAAHDLVNTDWGRSYGRSSPYCIALCYPTSPAPETQHRHEAHLRPVVWRSPSEQYTLNPEWQCGHTFEYSWYVPVDTVEYRSKACRRVSRSHALSPARNHDKVTRFCDSNTSERRPNPHPFLPESTGQDEVMGMLVQLASSMPRLTSNLSQIQEQVSNLSARVDQLSFSLNGRAGGGEGPGRPSHDLRGIARGDSGSMQPPGTYTSGDRRDHQQSWDRSDPKGGPNGTNSPVLEDSLEEIINAGVIAPSVRMGIVTDAASLPNAIPHGPGG
jgi:hypothetical protein